MRDGRDIYNAGTVLNPVDIGVLMSGMKHDCAGIADLTKVLKGKGFESQDYSLYAQGGDVSFIPGISCYHPGHDVWVLAEMRLCDFPDTGFGMYTLVHVEENGIGQDYFWKV